MQQIFINDDIQEFEREFGSLISANNIHFGCYSLLSSLYLFNATKILKKYEKLLIRNYHKPFLDLGYNAKIDAKFCHLAKLNIQLYLTDSSTSPIEILLMQGEYRKAIKVQNKLHLPNVDINKFQGILNRNKIKKVIVKDYKIIKKPLTLKQKIACAVAIGLCLATIITSSIMLNNYIQTQSGLIYKYDESLSGYIVDCGKFYNPKTLEIPMEHKGKKIIAISKGAFANKESLTEIVIYSNIQLIGDGAFYNCKNLKQIQIIDNSYILKEELIKCINTNIDIRQHYYISLYDNETMIDRLIVTYGENYICSPINNKLGYSFNGWHDGYDNFYTDANGKSLSEWTETTSKNLYSSYLANINQIIFNGNGATEGIMSNQSALTNSTIILKPNTYTKAGYTFVGWSTTANGDAEFVDSDDYVMGVNSIYTLYAIWQANTNQLVFDGNGATSGTMSNQSAQTDSTITLKANTYTKLGYTFIGWSTSPNGRVEFIDRDNYLMSANSKCTLYAIWEVILYRCIIELNNGFIEQDENIVFNIESETINIKTPYRLGYIFIGWTGTDVDGIATSYTIHKGTCKNISLTANWEAKTNEIVYDGNGSTSGNMTSQKVKTDEVIILKECDYLRTGYKFLGWSTNATGIVEFESFETFKMGAEEICILYAVWSEIFELEKDNLRNTATIIRYLENEDTIDIPQSIDGYLITKIGNCAFYNKSCKSVTLSNQIIEIGVKAFSYCSNLKEINIPINVISIGEKAFAYCYSLESIYFNARQIKSNGENSLFLDILMYCGTSKYIEGLNIIVGKQVSILSYGLFSCYENHSPRIRGIIFEEGAVCSDIQGYAFYNCNIIGKIYIPKTITYVGSNAFTVGEYLILCETFKNDNYNISTDIKTYWDYTKGTVIFDGNGATGGEMERQIIGENQKLKLDSCRFIKDGYKFAGWAISSFGEIIYKENAEFTYNFDKEFILYAKWEPKVNKIIFEGNGATSGYMNEQEIKTKHTARLINNKYVRTGYTFIGWSTSPTGEVEFYDADEYLMGTNESYILYAIWLSGDCYLINDENSFNLLTRLDYNQFNNIILIADLDFKGAEISNFTYFTTAFDGNGHTISNIKLINKHGLFDIVSNGTIKNLGLVNVTLTSNCKTGSFGTLVGHSANSTIEQCFTTGSVCVDYYTNDHQDLRVKVGGLVGELDSYTNNTIKNCYSTCDINAKANFITDAGGLIGSFVAGAEVTITIENCYATGDVVTYSNPNKQDSRAYSGAFIGDVNSYASATGTARLNISNCFAMGNLDAYANYCPSVYAFGGIANVQYNSSNIYTYKEQKFYRDGQIISSSNIEGKELLELIDFAYNNWNANIWTLTKDSLPVLK